MKPLHIILSVIGGAVAGAAVGLLLAPEKRGDNTRQYPSFPERERH